VFDPDGAFADRLNFGMVSLEELLPEDIDFLRDSIGTHHSETGSELAERILARFDSVVGSFRKVMPTDYRKVLEATAEAVADGRDVDEAIMEAARRG